MTPIRPRRSRSGALALVALAPLAAEAQSPDAEDVFRSYAPGVAKVEVFAAGTSAPASVGTAFFVGADGLLATNYHVVRDLAHEPEGHRAQVVLFDGSELEVTVVGVRAPADLALLAVDGPSPLVFELLEQPPERGRRMFSLGHPADLATAVVEGTFNGAVQRRVTPRYHFTGSINPGMSGGPSVTADGRVVGVNVSTAGNQLSFVVPAGEVAALLHDHGAGAFAERPLLGVVEDQLVALQERFVSGLLAAPLPTTRLGALRVPSGFSEAFDCSAVALQPGDGLFGGVRHFCETSDNLLAYRDAAPELLSVTHIQLESDALSPLRFHSLYTEFFQNLDQWLFAPSERATDYACTRSNVRTSSATLRVAVCARRNTGMPRLHDLFVRTAVLGGGTRGVVSTLRIGAVPLPTARGFLAAYLEAFAWES